ncbi:hypothetical protein RE011_004348 [Klebsiella aerogenes]|nr:hypothetical protein [Klebsiella aerogenes]
MELTISFSTILMAAFSFLGVYIIMPLALILRDQLIIMYIERCILTRAFWVFIHELTVDKAYYNVIYTKKYEVRAPEGFEHVEEKRTYFIDEIEVSLITFGEFLSNQKSYVDRIARNEPKALAKTNLMKWISKHFKMDAKFVDVVDDYVKHVYDLTVYDIKNKKKDVIVSDVIPS